MKLAFIMFRRVCSIKRVKIRLRQHCHLPSCRNDTFALGIMSLQEYSQCNRSKRKNECARGRAHDGEERAGEGGGGEGGTAAGVWVRMEKRRSGERKTDEKGAARWWNKKELNSFPRH